MPEAQCGRSASSRVSPVFTKTFCSAQASMRARPRLALLYSSPHAHAANALVAGKSRVKGPWRGGCDLTARHPRKAPPTSPPAGERPRRLPFSDALPSARRLAGSHAPRHAAPSLMASFGSQGWQGESRGARAPTDVLKKRGARNGAQKQGDAPFRRHQARG